MNERRHLRCRVWLLVVGLLIGSRAADAAGGKPLLLLADVDGPGTASLEQTLTAAGYDVTRVTPEFTWDGTNPSVDGFECVVHLNGRTSALPLPVDAQRALVAFVREGGGYIGSQWNGFERVSGHQVDMNDLVLQLWPHPDNCLECDMTWSEVPAEGDHPVLAGIPETFTFFADGHDAGPLVVFEQDPSIILMTSPGGGPAVIVREFEKGRVVSFSSAANHRTGLTLQDFNILSLYLNAANWACSAPPPPPLCNAPESITPADAPVSFVATSDDAGSTVEITAHDCFFVNGAGKRVDKTGSCSVDIDGDTLTVLGSGGVGTHIVWTAQAVSAQGTVSDPTTCEVSVANPGKGRTARGK